MTHQITDMLRSPQPGASVRPEDAGGIETLARFMAGGDIAFIGRWLAQSAEEAASPAGAARQLRRILGPYVRELVLCAAAPGCTRGTGGLPMPVTGAASGRHMRLLGRLHGVEYFLRHGWCRGWATVMLARDAKIAGEL